MGETKEGMEWGNERRKEERIIEAEKEEEGMEQRVKTGEEVIQIFMSVS
jgi:hypothetical protein